MKSSALASLLLASFAAQADVADDDAWYGKVTSGYLWAEGDAGLIGTTQSVYGGSPTFSMDNGGSLSSFSMALGRTLPMGWRIEGELSFLRVGTDTGLVNGLEQRSDDAFRLDGEVLSAVFMLNALYDFDVGSEPFTPYLKAGMGFARNDASAVMDVQFDSALWAGTPFEGVSLAGVSFPGTSETHLAWNVGVGLRTALSERLVLELEYGFIDLGEAATAVDPDNDAVVWSGLSSHRFLLGLDFRF
jgi:opacity protein-like surface antigen